MKKIYTCGELYVLVRPLMEKYRVAEARMFGSYARGDADENSDIDLLLIGRPDFRPMDVFSFAEDLHEASGKAVDVYELREIGADSALYRNILLEGVTI
ncbi:MAG: nucleotidyltransferase domain-containing protein [Clostridia bacterium]|nr:nucleotidyltransferase domain-containing protein [Clostridia bacterium]